MSTQPAPLVQVFAPDGTLGDIPYDKLHDAISAGAKLAAKIQAPDGTMGFVPADKRADAIKAGGKSIPFDLSDHDGEKPGFWSHVGQSIKSMVPQEPQSIGDAAKQGLMTSLGAAPMLYGAGQEAIAASQRGHGLPYSAAAGLSTMAGVSPERMEQAAEQGDTAGVLGEAAIPVALASGGELVSQSRVIPAARGVAREALFTPEGKPTALGKALSHPTEAAIEYGLRKVVGAPDAPIKGEAVNIRQSPNFDPAAYNAGRKGITPAEAAEAQRIQQGSGINVVPEPRALFPGENPNYMASVPRGTLEDLALASKPGAAVQLQQLAQSPIIYAPRGSGFSGVRESIPLSDLTGNRLTLRPNASGESGASMEAINRVASEKAVGLKRVRIDTRSGNEVPLIGADAVDAKPGPYDQIVMRDKNGNETVLDQGVRALPRRPKP